MRSSTLVSHKKEVTLMKKAGWAQREMSRRRPLSERISRTFSLLSLVRKAIALQLMNYLSSSIYFSRSMQFLRLFILDLSLLHEEIPFARIFLFR